MERHVEAGKRIARKDGRGRQLWGYALRNTR